MTLKIAVVPVTAFMQNCTVLRCEATGRGAVVDPGGDIDRILEAVQQLDATIEKILVTHAHIDHAGAVSTLAQQLELPIEGPHRGDQFWIDNLPTQGAMFGLPPAQSFEPDRWLEHGDTVTVGEQTLEVLHCPGHTPGHVVFFHREQGIAIVGDVVFKGGVGRSDFPGGDGPTLIRSIRERLFPLGDEVAFVCGHGPMSTFGEERRSNPFVRDR
jgi:glyoxylase-like metal-dependent hydrolase (beta-lactamase superfamily II)